MRRVKGCLRALVGGFLTIAGTNLDDPALGQAIGFQPIPAPLPSGAMLDVTPAVSADRRYVRLGINVSFNEISGFTTYSVPAAVSGGGAGMNGLIGGLGGAGGPGGLGGNIGARSVGLGGPAAAGAAPGLVFGSPAGDPFEQALSDPAAVSSPSTPSLSREEQLRSRNRSPETTLARSKRRASSRPKPMLNTRGKSTRPTPSNPERTLPELPISDFPFDP
jgi:hypothetical protein